MKIFKPNRYHETFRLTFLKKVDGKTEKRAFTVVETTREEIDALIRKEYADNLNRQNENRLDFVKLMVQIIRFETGKPRGKEEWSYRLYRASVDDLDRLTTAVTDSQEDNPDELTHSVTKISDQEESKPNFKVGQKITDGKETVIVSELLDNGSIRVDTKPSGDCWFDIDVNEVDKWRLVEHSVNEDMLRKASEEYLKVLSETPYNNTPVTNAQIIVKELVGYLDNPLKYDPNHVTDISEDLLDEIQ